MDKYDLSGLTRAELEDTIQFCLLGTTIGRAERASVDLGSMVGVRVRELRARTLQKTPAELEHELVEVITRHIETMYPDTTPLTFNAETQAEIRRLNRAIRKAES